MKRYDATIRATKLSALQQSEGYDDEFAFVAACSLDSVCPAICMNPRCDYTADLEPDQDEGWCEACGTNTLVSALVLAELI